MRSSSVKVPVLSSTAVHPPSASLYNPQEFRITLNKSCLSLPDTGHQQPA